MLGLIIAVIYGLIVYFFGEPTTLIQAFLSATSFLFWWYLVTCFLEVLLGLLACFGVLARLGSLLRKVSGLSIGGVTSIFILIPIAIGAYLLHLSVKAGEWDITKLVIGGILLFVGLLMDRVNLKRE
jgi:hypothetical protein